MLRSSLITLATAGALAALPLATAGAAGPAQEVQSGNWAGYTATGQQFSSASGSWVQPTVDCTAGDGSASFWVGLGGGEGGDSTGLEQTGTAADCTDGRPAYYAWYELIPDAPVRVGLAVSPGDRISASVTVDGTAVRVALRDRTTGQAFGQTLSTDNIDVSSAEWIAEAPSTCDDGGCETVDLADFGTAQFSGATATAGGHRGAISDPQWQATAMTLAGSSLGAAPSAPAGSGTAFSVTTAAAGDDYGSDPGYGSDLGYGSDPGYGYDGGGYDDYGYGYGYGYGGGYDDGYGGGFSFG